MTSTVSRSISSPLSRRNNNYYQTSTNDSFNLSESFPLFVYTNPLVTIVYSTTSAIKENQQILLNSYSSCRRFLDHLKLTIGVQQDEMIDLIDNEGKWKDLNSHADEYASQFLTARNTYYVAKLEIDSSGDKNYTLLLNFEQIDSAVMRALKNAVDAASNKPKVKTNPRSFKQNSSGASASNTTGGRKRTSAKK